MTLHNSSLLLAILLLSGCLSIILFSAWLVTRTEKFLITWSVGLAVLVAAMGLCMAYLEGPRPHLALPTFAALLVGFAIIEGAGRQFATGSQPLARITIISAVSVTLIAPFFLAGISGMGTSLANFLACAILISAGLHYWRSRAENPVLITVLGALYIIVGLSFLLCAVVILIETPIVRVRTPDNWAENLNALASIIGLAGVGAISLALNQARLVRRLKADARTDPLTGLLNRRALFERHGSRPLPVGTIVAIFDLDHFKTVNDLYGHGVGDDVLKRFARLLERHAGMMATCVRTGGEEFVLVIEKPVASPAYAVADRIRRDFSKMRLQTEKGLLSCTLSVGIASADEPRRTLDILLREADLALYAAKRNGRNQIAMNDMPAAA